MDFTNEPLNDAALDVITERRRQKSVERWTAEHDDTHDRFEMARAAAFYALHPAAMAMPIAATGEPSERSRLVVAAEEAWPPQWGREWQKPKPARRSLVFAAALLLAEIERLDRLEAKREQNKWAAQGKKRRDAAAKTTERKIREMGQ
jgi:hypothetical protein